MAAIFQTTFSNAFSLRKMYQFSLKISLKVVLMDPNNNISALVQIIAWHRQGNKPLFEPMMVGLLMHMCITQPQWVDWDLDKIASALDVMLYFLQCVAMPTYKSSTSLAFQHWGRDKMAAIFQTTFSNGFSWMKMYEFRLTFHLSLFLRVQLTIFQHWFR